MSIKQDQAAAKMAEECQGKEYLVPIEEYLTSICTTDRVAEKILAPGKSLKGSFDCMKSAAEKRIKTKTGTQCVAISDDEGFDIIREYFKITDDDLSAAAPATSGVIDITSFL